MTGRLGTYPAEEEVSLAVGVSTPMKKLIMGPLTTSFWVWSPADGPVWEKTILSLVLPARTFGATLDMFNPGCFLGCLQSQEEWAISELL